MENQAGNQSQKMQKALRGVVQPGEQVLDWIEGLRHQGAVLTDRRVIVAKSGINAGAVMGAKVTSFPFDLISAIEVQTSGVRTVLTVQTPGGRSSSGFLSGNTLGNDVWSSPNTVPFGRADHDRAQRFAQHATRVRSEKVLAGGNTPAVATSVADELSKLAALRDAGILSEAEFTDQKARLLSS
jgi:hypothetical protein